MQTRIVATAPVNCVSHTADQVIENLYVRRQGRTNIVIQDCKGNVTVSNVVSVGSKPPDPDADQFGGQGLYADTIGGTLTIEDSYIGYSGIMMPDEPPSGYYTPTMYRHDVYVNDAVGGLIVQRCILGPAANGGVQSRVLKGPSLITGNLILDCGTAILAIEGGATVTGNVIYLSHRYFDGSDGAGGSAVKTYWPMLADKNVIIAGPNQGTFPGFPNHPNARDFPAAMIDVGGFWKHADPAWAPIPGYTLAELEAAANGQPGGRCPPEYLAGSGNVAPATGWPGAKISGPTKMPGWASAPRVVQFDFAPALAAIEAGGSVAAGMAAIKAGLGVI